ncbi:MAG: D-amino acid aminotransferase [Janthinobacterium lividum]
MHDPLVYLNGALTPLSEAKIPVLDRGFIFGDGVYEVIPIYQGRPFRAEQHMARLARSLAAIGITNLYTPQQWMEIIGTVVAAQSDADQLVYMQVTRGVAPRAHAFPKTPVTPTVFIMSNPLVLPSAALRSSGARCVTMEDQRWLHCEIKSVSLLGNILAAQHAVEHEATEAIQFRDGFLTEASSSNVWVVKDGAVYGPPKDNLILEGIRYGLLQELCAALGIPFASRRLTRAELMAADEVLLSSATKELLAVSTIDGQAIGEGKPGAVYEKLYQAYRVATGR